MHYNEFIVALLSVYGEQKLCAYVAYV